MPEPYQVYKVVAQPELTEQLGSKPKFWFRWPPDEQAWLFKFSREGTGEDWAEKIAAELAVRLQIPAAHVELAEFSGRRGTISRSFVERDQGWSLVHGDELLEARVHGYRRDQVFHLSEHTLDNILLVFRQLFADATALRVQMSQFAGYLVLDGLIGNVDRHHQNWGILRRVHPDGRAEEKLAPTFDHASSLGRNEPPASRSRRLHEQTVGKYVQAGRGGIFLSSQDRRGANPLDLVLRTAPAMPEMFAPWLERVRGLSMADVGGIIDRVSMELMDADAKKFALAFIAFTRERLSRL